MNTEPIFTVKMNDVVSLPDSLYSHAHLTVVSIQGTLGNQFWILENAQFKNVLIFNEFTPIIFQN